MKPTQACRLQNDDLAVTVLPHEGGRISSLLSLRSGMEYLTQSHREEHCVQASMEAAFENGPCAGIEECLPTVGRSGPQTEGGPAPDHGDFWQLGWNVTSTSETELHLEATGFSRPLRFSKSLTLEHNVLRIRYLVENVGPSPQSFLYACHPLFAVSQGDRIFLPRETTHLRLNYSRHDRLGELGTMIPWPGTKSCLDLSVAESDIVNTAEMFYTAPLAVGRCGLYREAARQGLIVSFDTARLPYLGLWLCYGGWPDRDTQPKQYAVALEPTTCACNTLAEAQQAGSAVVLDSGQSYEWEILFEISVPGISCAEFNSLLFSI